MRRALFFSLLLLAAAIPSVQAADTAYLDCPTFFTNTYSNITGNAYLGSPAQPSCDNTKVILCSDNGLGVYSAVPTVQPASGGTCTTPVGRWTWNASADKQGTYNYTMYVRSAAGPAVTCANAQAAAGLPGSHPELSRCTVQRASFKNSVTIPEFDVLLLPLVAVAGLFILSRRSRKQKQPK